ncbi:MAG TPA: histidine kinase, partial [Pseudolysinimonas sp.]|nr:histidine kinase [Pseudolysinimonas sp.]
MDLISKERDRLLQRTARVWGLSFTVVALACYVLPGAVNTEALLGGIPLFIAVGAFQAMMGWMRPALWAALSVIAGLGIVAVSAWVGTGRPSQAGLA